MKMNLRRWKSIAVAGGVIALLAGCASGVAADEQPTDEPVTFSYAHLNNPEHFNAVAAQAWMDAVTEATDESVTFEPFWSGSLCSAADMSQCVTDGVADIGWTSPSYNPANHPIANIAAIGFITKDLNAFAIAMNRLHAESPELQAEYEALGQKLLYFEPFIAPGLASVNSDLTEIDDLAGQKIRAVGSWVTALEYLGAVPVNIDFNEQYESLERGLIDGSSVPAPAVLDLGLEEVITDFYDLAEYLGVTTTMQAVMNLDAWETLSPTQQKTIETVTAELIPTKATEIFAPFAIEACDALKDAGVAVRSIEPSDNTERWMEEVGTSQRDAWAASSGLEDADGYFEKYMSWIDAETTPESDKSMLDYCSS